MVGYGGDLGVKGGSYIIFQTLVSLLVCEKINFHKEKDGISLCRRGMQYKPTYDAKTESRSKSVAAFCFPTSTKR